LTVKEALFEPIFGLNKVIFENLFRFNP